jgi:hypothetical protein
MAEVTRIGEDTFSATGFVQAHTYIACVVRFENGNARVIRRTGTAETIWDERAVAVVQSSLIAGTVIDCTVT